MLTNGQAVKFVDSHGVEHDALVTATHGPECVNLVLVNTQEGQRDDYGQKLIRHSSVVHRNLQPAHGMYFFVA